MNSEQILDTTPPPSDFRLSYGTDANNFGDLRLPSTTGPHPVVIFVHGGFWRARYGLEYAGHLCAALTAAGIATWNIEYRRLGNEGGGYPGTLLDVARAADFLREIAPTYNLDLSRVVVTGHSAGGHLAAWLAGRQHIPVGDELYTRNPLRFKGVVPLAGVLNLRRACELHLSDNVTEQFMGGTPADYPDRYAFASPEEMLALGVPQIIIHGTEDSSVPYEISLTYYDTAVALGDEATLITLEGAGHFEMVDPNSSEWQQVFAAITGLLGNKSQDIEP
ncbi:MAG: alpha/beta hydrolase [Chloroflexi bacterium]|uniref:Alpha/beta hydrolase n=1 Tax=Candidatus Chlorohelix allophototropha TaxID=3003348 RepID=A0A8T7M3K4_9CHLR|nr:alpha/beta hydrolase [Chloroflexota bacterium]WJW65552.1 alpha/beta hydrolase [Chloroflexota bacterium L227-S17]